MSGALKIHGSKAIALTTIRRRRRRRREKEKV